MTPKTPNERMPLPNERLLKVRIAYVTIEGNEAQLQAASAMLSPLAVMATEIGRKR